MKKATSRFDWKRFVIQFSVISFVALTVFPGKSIHANHASKSSNQESGPQTQWVKDQMGKGLSDHETVASSVVSEQFTKQISSIEWLAPLAPVALSPFFGITLLSGLACFGPDWLPDNALMSDGSPLANPTLFWVFLVLTVITSAPRFSKVSKPIAQMADFLETYSAIVILLVLKVMSMEAMSGGETETAGLGIVQAGFLSSGWEGLLMIAMVINIVVVNSVKFFFEFLVWITPIPFLDACFEVANKSLCAGLMAIYAFSPLAALAINIILFVVCALAFTWIRRREIFYRTMLIDWVIQLWTKSKAPIPSQFVVFPKQAIGNISARARSVLQRSETGWSLTHKRLLRTHLVEELTGAAELDQGWWTSAIVFDDGRRLTFSSKFNDQLAEVASSLEVGLGDAVDRPDHETGRQIEFA